MTYEPMAGYQRAVRDAERKQAVWQRVEELAFEAFVLLNSVNEGVYEQAQLLWIAEKAPVQVKLWDTKGGS
jgi:hypothetical protein